MSNYVRRYRDNMYLRPVLETNINSIACYINIVYSVLQVEILNEKPGTTSGFLLP